MTVIGPPVVFVKFPMLSVVCDKATVVEIVSCVAGDISAAVVNSMSAEKNSVNPSLKTYLTKCTKTDRKLTLIMCIRYSQIS